MDGDTEDSGDGAPWALNTLGTDTRCVGSIGSTTSTVRAKGPSLGSTVSAHLLKIRLTHVTNRHVSSLPHTV